MYGHHLRGKIDDLEVVYRQQLYIWCARRKELRSHQVSSRLIKFQTKLSDCRTVMRFFGIEFKGF
jgi:hypothetical protein